MEATRRLRIGELARLAGVSTRTVRHYHHVGVLPEPERTAAGYRMYGLTEVARLLRARQLVELGMSLGEVADALADPGGADLREVLSALRDEVAAQEARAGERRVALEGLLVREGDLTRSEPQQEVLSELERVLGSEHPGLPRERLLVDVLGAGTDAEQAGRVWQAYTDVLGDPEQASGLQQLSERFEALTTCSPQDPAVDELAREGGNLGQRLAGLLPAELRDGPGDPAAAERVLAAAATELSPAQARCLELMSSYWREATGQ